MNIWVVCKTTYVWITLQLKTVLYTSHAHEQKFFLGIFLQVQWLHHRICTYSNLPGTAKLSPKAFTPIKHLFTNAWYYQTFFFLTNLVDIQKYFIILLFICPIINVVEHLFMFIGHLNFFSAKVPCKSFVQSSLSCLSFYYSHGNFLYIMDNNP